MFKVFYDPRQSVKENESFSPSAGKPEQVVKSWSQLGIPMEIAGFKPVQPEDLYLVHAKKYVDDLLACKIPNGFGNHSEPVAAALPWVSGSMVAASLYALKNSENTFSPTSGAHHAHYSRASGYCSFNFLMLAAVKAKMAGAKRVGILDADAHPSDGCMEIIDKLGLDWLQLHSFGACGIQNTSDATEWLKRLPEVCFSFEGCDLILYNAGVDSHVDDPLGGFLTTEKLATRDMYVYETFYRLGIPVATSLAGGYQRDKDGSISFLLDLHNQTFQENWKAFQRRNSQISA